MPELRSHLERKCDGNHVHLPWGLSDESRGFATADECAYNEHMCASWAQGVADYATKLGYVAPPPDLEHTASQDSLTQINKALLGCLPRGRKVPPILTDWLEPTVCAIGHLPSVQSLPVGKRIPDSVTAFPQGSRLVRFTNDKGVTVEVHGENLDELPKFALVGIPRDPGEFLVRACTLVHPVQRSMQVGVALKEAIATYIDGDGLEFRRVQCCFSQHMLSLCDELKKDEERLHSGMPLHLQKILKGKRLCLFNELLKECGYPDTKIAREMGEGFPLCGWLPQSDVFPLKLRPPELHVGTLELMSASFSARAISSTLPSGDAQLDRLLWQATMEEVQAGYLTGPFVRSELPVGAVVSPRFGLLQKAKLRPIDNFTASQVNSTVGLRDKLQVDSIDEICAMIKCWAQQSGGRVRLVGRSYDLRRAYRQIGIMQDHLKFGWISVWDPDSNQPRLFRMESMPFGATASVGAFLRLSQALKCLGVARCALVWSSFYDDFVCVCPASASQQVDRMIRLFFKVLGWQLSTDEAKDTDFSRIFQALGVEFDLSRMSEGFFMVGNTQARKTELRERIGCILDENCLKVAEATSLRSRLLFADAQVFGRFAKSALHEIGRVGLGARDMQPLTGDVKRSLVWMRDRVLSDPPRKIDFTDSETLYMFLDGACTDANEAAWSGTSIGGVLAYPDGSVREYFGEILPQEMVALWGRNDQQQYIFEAEIMPYAVSLFLWRSVLKGKCAFVFIDNEGARSAWICGFAATKAAQHMLHVGTTLEAKLSLHAYFARVPTHSNMGDGPSRGNFSAVEKLGGKRLRVPQETLECLMKPGDGSWTPFKCDWG